LEIVILDKQSDKLIRMEVQPKHTIGSIIETIVDKQKMDRSQRYRLTLGNQSFAKEQYLLKVKDAGINQGDHLFLEAEGAARKPILEAEPIVQTPKYCRQCGKPLRENAKYCLNCGAPIRKQATMSSS
jgi:zinc-ribbon domain